MALTKEQADSIAEVLTEELDYEAEVREDYSGRGMYGATCVGIITDAPLVLVGWAAGYVGITDVAYLPMCTDNMGLSTIVY